MDSPLTKYQLQVVKAPYEPCSTLKVIAGPGSGKTLTLLFRIRHLILTGQIRPDEILVLSLTNKAVENIMAKLTALFETVTPQGSPDEYIKIAVNDIKVITIHGLANRIVTENEGMISVIEESGWRGLMKLVSKDRKTVQSSKPTSTRELQRQFKKYQDGESKNGNLMEKLAEVMQSCRVVTNEELITRATFYLSNPTDHFRALSEREATLTADIKSKFKVIFIDEFQDLFPALLPFLCEVSAQKQLTLFGDPNQNIYEFLGSNQKAIEQLEAVNKNFRLMNLHDNFRSTPEITTIADSIIHHVKPYNNLDAALKGPCGVPPQIFNITDPLDEGEFVVNQICQLVCSSVVKLSDIAVLTRTNAHLQSIAHYLGAYNIRYEKLTSQPDWLSDIRIQFLIDLLRLAIIAYYETSPEKREFQVKWKSDFSVIVTLSAIRGISDQSIQRLYLDCRLKSMSFWRYLTDIPKSKWPVTARCKQKIEVFKMTLQNFIDDGAILRIDDHSQLFKYICNAAYTFDCQIMQINNKEEADDFKWNLEQMFAVMKDCAYHSNNELSLPEHFLESYFEKSTSSHTARMKLKDQDVINLSTIHSSKGLEFPIVFLMGTPHSTYPMESKVLYVGMTRARNLLYLNNINHPKIESQLKKPAPNLLPNKKFWGYYSNDLNRLLTASSGSNLHNYSMLRDRYGLSSYNKRALCTMCKGSLGLLSRYIL